MEDPPTPPPTEDDEAPSVPIEYVLGGLDDPFVLSAGYRKVAKRTFPFTRIIGATIQLALAEDIPARKKQRLEEPPPTSTDEATAENTLHYITAALPPLDAAAAAVTATDNAAEHAAEYAAEHADSDPVVDSSIDPAEARTGEWTAEEDKQLKDAVPAQGCKDWFAIASKVPSRTRVQCRNRWHDALVSNIDPTTALAGKWEEDEDKMLKEAVRTHGGKNWAKIAALVLGRTKNQCKKKWHDTLNFNIDPTTASTGKWTGDEDKKLREAVGAHGAKNWGNIATLVPGRTKNQCHKRWHDALDPSIGQANGRTGKWEEDEDKKLREAVGAHGAKNWGNIATLVPGRTKNQCRSRWHAALICSIDPTTALAGKWEEDEDKMLKDAVRAHGTEIWAKIALFVPGRTKSQCCSRWHNTLVSALAGK
jgi:hypothetical protein